MLSYVRFLSATVYTYRSSAARGSKSSRIVVQGLEEIFCIMEESMVSVVCLCVHRDKDSSLIQGKETKYLMIGSKLTA